MCEGNEPEGRAGWWLPRWVLRRRQWWGPQDGTWRRAEGWPGAGGPQKSTWSPAEQEATIAGSLLEGLLRQGQGASGGEPARQKAGGDASRKPEGLGEWLGGALWTCPQAGGRVTGCPQEENLRGQDVKGWVWRGGMPRFCCSQISHGQRGALHSWISSSRPRERSWPEKTI